MAAFEIGMPPYEVLRGAGCFPVSGGGRAQSAKTCSLKAFVQTFYESGFTQCVGTNAHTPKGLNSHISKGNGSPTAD